ncbi:hypothetical protein LK09_18150 [Microbacterium mangrovi]|uniref:Uncharacterized protein n=1 Tax=Microbacterium mangrovi TaxID=1348253 RepID=A0A0B1ZYF0_9MICO|nr:hypothetical protein [Microbacterium mangrovi]KHK95751.1 hypothetical protein LK09_18150 [Microbacterium mangrovi]
MSEAIGLHPDIVDAGIRLIRSATEDFDTSVARKAPTAADTGLAEVPLERMLIQVAETGLRLTFELDTLADAAEAGARDLAAYEERARSDIARLGERTR